MADQLFDYTYGGGYYHIPSADPARSLCGQKLAGDAKPMEGFHFYNEQWFWEEMVCRRCKASRNSRAR